MIAEVASEETRRIDEGEKRDAYTTISSLSVYLLVEQAAAQVVVFRRGERGSWPAPSRAPAQRRSTTTGAPSRSPTVNATAARGEPFTRTV